MMSNNAMKDEKGEFISMLSEDPATYPVRLTQTQAHLKHST